MQTNDRLQRVEVIYALPDEQMVFQILVSKETTVAAAIEQSGILQQYPEIDLTVNHVGIFGRMAKLDSPLKEGDRIEIYRPLLADPKEIRRRRAAV